MCEDSRSLRRIQVDAHQIRSVLRGVEAVDRRQILVDEGDRLGDQILERPALVERDVVEILAAAWGCVWVRIL